MTNKFLVVILMLLSVMVAGQQNPPASAGASTPTAAKAASVGDPGAPTVSTVLGQQLGRVEKDLLAMVNEMPAAKFDFAPSNGEFKGVRTFADQLRHLAGLNYRVGSVIAGEKSPVSADTIAAAKTKEQIVKLLGESYAYAHKALATVTEKNLVETISVPFGSGKANRLGLAIIMIGDQWDHYGQMVVYFRMNGMVPPASRR